MEAGKEFDSGVTQPVTEQKKSTVLPVVKPFLQLQGNLRLTQSVVVENNS